MVKIQIMGRKITENLGFESPLQMVKTIVQLSAKMNSIATKEIAVGGGLAFRHLVCLY